jgi:hypothetical protein
MEDSKIEHSAATHCSLEWVPPSIAATWPVGCKVLIRMTSPDGDSRFDADNWHRPDWVDAKNHRYKEWIMEWAILELSPL